MSQNLTETSYRIFLLGLLLSFALGLNYLHAWTAPTQAPTGGNVAAPLNTGGTLQAKSGGLQASSLDINGTNGVSLVGGQLSFWKNSTIVNPSYTIDMGPLDPGANNGIRFPDDTVMTTAASGGGQGLSFSKYLHVREEQPNGVDPAGVTVGSYGTRVLNTVVTNTIVGASLASNRITLPTGSYYVDAFASSYSGGRHRAQLYNVTRATTAVMGTSGYGAASNDEDVTESFIKGVFVVTGASESFDIRHRSVDGGRGGIADAFGTAEYYTPVEIWKLD